MDPQLRSLLTETAYYKTVTSVTVDGVETLSAAVSFLCRTEYQVYFHGPLYLPRQGEDKEFAHRIFTEVDIPENALIWLPGLGNSDLDKAQRIRRREKIRDEQGNISHYEIYI